jgi:ribosome production factor 2
MTASKIPRKNGKRMTRRATVKKPKGGPRGGGGDESAVKRNRPGKAERMDPSLLRTNSSGKLTLKSAQALGNEQRKPKTKRGERMLKKAEPQLFENTKSVLVMKGNKTSQVVVEVLRDIALLCKPNCKVFSRNNEILPFEDASGFEYFGEKNDCSLIVMGSHNKKRPDNLVLARLYDGHILDMFEFGVDECESIQRVSSATADHRTKGFGSKPLMIFVGDQWESDSTYVRIQNLLLDLFRGTKVDKISLKGLDHVLACTVVDGHIYVRAYSMRFKKSGSKVPLVQLSNMGPFWNLSLRRNQMASDELWKTACKQPKVLSEKKVKNVHDSNMGDKIGRLHIEKQDLSKMSIRRVDALRSSVSNKSKAKKSVSVSGNDNDDVDGDDDDDE